MDSSFENFMKIVEGTPTQKRFLERVTSIGFTLGYKEYDRYSVADFDPTTKMFVYDPTRFNFFILFHEKQHLIAYERARKFGVPLDKLFGGKRGAILETDAYLAEQWLCKRYDFPKDFTSDRREILHEYIHKARTALRNKESLRELMRQVLGYDIQLQIEEYFSRTSSHNRNAV
jgi:hypothetical protein